MIKIKCFCDFCDNVELKNEMIRSYQLNDSKIYGKDYVFVDDDNEYTHAIIINTCMPDLSIPKENVIGLAWEPIPFLRLTREFINYAKEHIGKYIISERSERLGEPFINYKCFLTYNDPVVVKPEKKSIMSIMISNKTYAPGHMYRHQLAQSILKTDLPIDIWGRGCMFYKNIGDSRIKGLFNKEEPYHPYIFHIAIENFKTEHYYSEKIMNCFVSHTIPVYLGCKNINTYFNEPIIALTGNLDEDIKILHDICSNVDNYISEINLEEVLKSISIEPLIVKDWCNSENTD